MWRIMSAYIVLVALVAGPDVACGGETSSKREGIWQSILRLARQKEAEWKRCCRSCTQNWFRNRPQPKYGLKLRQPSDAHPTRPLVVFVHGLNSRPEDLKTLIRDAETAGFSSATFRYPNDQSLSESAQLLADELGRIKRASASVVIVSHSMGSLIARECIEDTRLDPGNVVRLIMIAPPNHGSQLARVAFSLDLIEYFGSPQRRDESGFIYGSILDGLSEATDDLTPGSPFLRKLNSRPRNKSVGYTIVLGTAGPVRTAQLDECVSRVSSRCHWIGKTYARLGDEFSNFGELIAGQGDGLVSVERGRLDGVDDLIVGHFEHNELLQADCGRAAWRARRQILARIGRPHAVTKGSHARR